MQEDTQTNTIDTAYCRAANDCSGDSRASKTNGEWILTVDANYVTNITFIYWYHCSIDDYNDFTFYASGICYFYSITQIAIGNTSTLFSLYPVTTSITGNRLLKQNINELYFIALISAVIGIIVSARASFIFNSSHDQEDNNGNKFEYYTSRFYFCINEIIRKYK